MKTLLVLCLFSATTAALFASTLALGVTTTTGLLVATGIVALATRDYAPRADRFELTTVSVRRPRRVLPLAA